MWLIKKAVLFCLTAPGLFFIILFVNAFVFTVKKSTQRFKLRFLLISVIITYLITTSIATKPILHRIEGDCFVDLGRLNKVDAIVVLTGGTEKDFEKDQFSKTANTTMKRIVVAAAIYNEIKKPIIILGGVTKKGEPAESTTASNVLVALGVPTNNIMKDEKSTNTYENIEELEKIAHGSGFREMALVSSASHIPRIRMLLERKRLNVTLVPTACTASSKINFEDFVPSIRNMNINMTLLYELLGNIKYAIYY